MYQPEQKIEPLARLLNRDNIPKIDSVNNKVIIVKRELEELLSSNQLLEENRKDLLSFLSKFVLNRQISKQKIANYISTILEKELSSKILSDLDLEASKTLTIVGRPKVIGSSEKQMRHVSPFALTKEFIKSVIKKADGVIELVFFNLSQNIKYFIDKSNGYCLNEDQFMPLDLDKENVFILKTRNNTYYLVNEEYIGDTEIEVLRKNIGSEIEVKQNMKLYTQKKLQLIDYCMQKIQSCISDESTFIIASEILVRFILTFFNESLYAAFPKEGNTLNYEIRKYASINDAKKPKDKKYDIKSHSEIAQEIATLGKAVLDSTIRIVDNEGSMVTKVIEALNILNTIVQANNVNQQELILEYNNKYNITLKLSNSYNIGEYNEALAEPDIMSKINYHVAKNLYLIFDFKPLEKVVFAPSTNSNDPSNPLITVFPSTDADGTATYKIQPGDFYRSKALNNARGYNKEATFRNDKLLNSRKKCLIDDINNNNFLEVLSKLIDKHIYFSLLTFSDLMSIENASNTEVESITGRFLELIKLDYQATDMHINYIRKFIDDEDHSIASSLDTVNATYESSIQEVARLGENGEEVLGAEFYY